MERLESDGRALGELKGTLATAWLDERRPESVFLARGISRPLWLGRTRTDLFFASTRRALAIVEAALRIRLDTSALKEGRQIEVVDGQVVRTRRFRPDKSYREEIVSPVHSPHEAVSCLAHFAKIAAAAV
jgi:glucosamine 6-phosphate synthetase-like amidotransferase/phosphosugar isomerase protein